MLLEKGIYAEETAGNLDEAIGIYGKIVAEARENRKFVAQAYYRLGQCYLKKGDRSKATEAFERLIAEYPEQKELVGYARSQVQVPGGGNASLVFEPSRYEGVETFGFSIQSVDGAWAGTFLSSVHRIRQGNADIWRIENFRASSPREKPEFDRVDVTALNYTPVAGERKTAGNDTEIIYRRNEVAVTAKAMGKQPSQCIPAAANIYDSAQLIHLVQRLPLKEGYQAAFPLFLRERNEVAECRLAVTGVQKVYGSFGEPACYLVNLALYAGSEKVAQQYLYYTVEDHLLVKYDTGKETFNYMYMQVKDRSESGSGRKVEDFTSVPGWRYSFTLPEGWNTCYFRDHKPYRVLMQFLPPGLNAWGFFLGLERTGGEKSVREIAEVQAAATGKQLKGYSVRPDSWTGFTVIDLPAVQYLAGYKADGKEMVESRTYILGRGMIYTFIFRTETRQWERLKPEVRAILSGFTETKGEAGIPATAPQPGRSSPSGSSDRSR
jgi:hypothetical protein